MPTATSSDIGSRIAERLADSIGARRYAMWFDHAARFDYADEGAALRIRVPNRFVADWIERHFEQELRDAAERELGHAVSVGVEVDRHGFERCPAAGVDDAPASAQRPNNGDAPSTREAPASRAAHGRSPGRSPGRSHGQRRPAPRLDGFVVGPSNELAYAAACRLADADAEPTGPLFLHGGCGLGKTHLLQGIAQRLIEQHDAARVLYTTGEQFTNDYITAVRANKLDGFRKRIRQLDLLAVDDVHFIANKQATQQEFLHSFDQIELCGARVVLASDSHPKLIRQFSEALVSRCVRGLVVQIAPPDAQTRHRLVETFAKRRGLILEPDVCRAITSQTHGSVREIEGTLAKLQALAGLRSRGHARGGGQTVVGHALVRQLFAHDPDRTNAKPVTFDTVLACVCQRLGITRAQVLGPSRHRLVVLGRAIAIHLARTLTSMSYPEIAMAMDRKNHSTVITAAQRIARQLACDPPPSLPPEAQAPTLDGLLEELKTAIFRA